MNVYDFDRTIFQPDSSGAFYRYCLKHHFAAVIRTAPASAVKAVLYSMGKIQTKELKEQLFSFLPMIENVDDTVISFWKENEKGLQNWYLRQKRDDDLIISASPEFLLRPVCDRLGVRLIATQMDKKTGKISGLNCHDSEKVRRFEEEYPGEHIECFYSDSLSDFPMALLADRAYLVNGTEINPWPEKKQNTV